MSKRQDREIKDLAAVAKKLYESFDTVQIFVTKHVNVSKDEEQTIELAYGLGNHYGRVGQIFSWLEKEKASSASSIMQEPPELEDE